jgi:arylformamidase
MAVHQFDKKGGSVSNRFFISYPWGPSCPGYGGGESVTITPNKRISDGDSCNSVNISAPNHCGTHFDFPKHFCNSGKNLDQIHPDEFFFDKIGVIWLEQPKTILDVELFEAEILKNGISPEIEILLIRTGSGLFRNERKYWETGHGIGSGVADLFRKNFPNLRCLGLDFISVSSWTDRDLGRKVHRELLCDENKSFTIIEDMQLEPIKEMKLISIVALPLRIEKGDGAPCTVVALSECEAPCA